MSSSGEEVPVVKRIDNACTCFQCRQACNGRPGWLVPEDVPDLLELLGHFDLDEALEAGELVWDWWSNGAGPVTPVLSPNLDYNIEKHMPADPRGRCIFFEGGRCRVHAAKPFECAAYHHDDTSSKVMKRHRSVVDRWLESDTYEPDEDTLAEMQYLEENSGFGLWGL